jgi:periodic tryptophan protein 2
VCYSADGSSVIAGGYSKYICIYHVAQKILLKKFQLSRSRIFDGVLDYLNSSHMTEAGPIDTIDDPDSSDDER